MAKRPEKNQKEPETTGHSWDGIEEYNNPMPRWWVWTFYVTIIWALGYTIAYPAWPGIKGATTGLLGWSTRANVAADIESVETRLAPMNDKLASVELASIAEDDGLRTYATSAGSAVFKTWCAQCHGSGAAGFKGYPNLQDDDWLWGGTMEDIHYTLTVGIRSPDHEDTRFNDMAAYGRDELLEVEEIDAVVNYVMSLSGEAKDPSQVEAGQVVFEDNCTSCHGEDAKGMRELGAPNLVDAIWLYGDGYDNIYETIYNGRAGVMPNWDTRLSEAEIRAVATYVHQLGGGE